LVRWFHSPQLIPKKAQNKTHAGPQPPAGSRSMRTRVLQGEDRGAPPPVGGHLGMDLGTLLAMDEEDGDAPPGAQDPEPRHNLPAGEGTDCVAIGLSTADFPLHRFMPGWTSDSYGYHSDDGGLFHGRGQMLHPYGPKFGPGDVVGCGVNYRPKKKDGVADGADIFFTLNGKLLGTAFQRVHGQLYPTVGIDARVTVEFNWGYEGGFVFDLGSYETQHCHLPTSERAMGPDMLDLASPYAWPTPPSIRSSRHRREQRDCKATRRSKLGPWMWPQQCTARTHGLVIPGGDGTSGPVSSRDDDDEDLFEGPSPPFVHFTAAVLAVPYRLTMALGGSSRPSRRVVVAE